MPKYVHFFLPNSLCALEVASSEKSKYHTVWLKEMNSRTSVLPNTGAWEQQELNKPKKQEKVRLEARVWKEVNQARKKKFRRPKNNKNRIIINIRL